MPVESPYYCKSCLTVRLVTTRFLWWEYPLVLVLLRPYRCPHCFQRYIRPFVL